MVMASQVLATISRDERERARLMSEFKFEIDTQSRIEQGRRDGLREGKREGLRKGRLEGVWEGKVEIAKILKGMGESVGKIARVTGLSLEEIAAL
jgi:predicted transposase YdaD